MKILHEMGRIWWIHGAKYVEIEKRGSEEAHWNKYGWEPHHEKQRIPGIMHQTWHANVWVEIFEWKENYTHAICFWNINVHLKNLPSEIGTAWLMVLCAEITIRETLVLGYFAQDLAFKFFFFNVHLLNLGKPAGQIL